MPVKVINSASGTKKKGKNRGCVKMKCVGGQKSSRHYRASKDKRKGTKRGEMMSGEVNKEMGGNQESQAKLSAVFVISLCRNVRAVLHSPPQLPMLPGHYLVTQLPQLQITQTQKLGQSVQTNDALQHTVCSTASNQLF